MKIRLKRVQNAQEWTAGALYIDGVFQCATLEDEKRKVKVKGETAIPAGKYEIYLRTEGGLTQKYAQKFPGMHKGMLWLQDVPNFEWVYIHVGNTPDDSEGCILVGESVDYKRGTLGNSVPAYKLIYPKIAQAIMDGDKVTIEITDV